MDKICYVWQKLLANNPLPDSLYNWPSNSQCCIVLNSFMFIAKAFIIFLLIIMMDPYNLNGVWQKTNISKGFVGRVFNILITTTTLLALQMLSLIWWIKLSFPSKWIPEYFWLELHIVPHRGVIEINCGMMSDFPTFMRKNYFLSLFSYFRIEWHFPLTCSVRNLDQVIFWFSCKDAWQTADIMNWINRSMILGTCCCMQLCNIIENLETCLCEEAS